MAMATLSGLGGAISSLSLRRHHNHHHHHHHHSLPSSTLGGGPPPSLLQHMPRCPLAPAAQKNSDNSGDAESKAILDAFFLGKALAETFTERLGSAVGEFLSEIGRQQAEQQKAIREFQEDVQERAKVSKTKAIREKLGIEQAINNYSNGAPTYDNISYGTRRSYPPPIATPTEISITSPTVVVEDPQTSVSDITIEGGND